MIEIQATSGEQITLTFGFSNPERPSVAPVDLEANTMRFRVYGPDGRLFADSRFHSDSSGNGQLVPANPQGIIPGQLLEGNGNDFLYLLGFPLDAQPGIYTAEATARAAGHSMAQRFARIFLSQAPRLEISTQLTSQQQEYAVSFWIRASSPRKILLLRELYLMALSDRTRRPVPAGNLFAFAKHEDHTQTNLLPLSEYTLRTGWTRLVISSHLMQLPVIDRFSQPVAYHHGPRWANPYYRDHLTYDIDGQERNSPLAWSNDFGPGPLFYVYLNDPHWGCRDFRVRWEDHFRIVADSSGDVQLSDSDPRRRSIICRPDFRDQLEFFPFALPALNIPLAALRSQNWEAGYQMYADLEHLILNYPPLGPGRRHDFILPELFTTGLSPYYNFDTELTIFRPGKGSFSRFMVGYEQTDPKVQVKPPEQFIRIERP